MESDRLPIRILPSRLPLKVVSKIEFSGNVAAKQFLGCASEGNLAIGDKVGSIDDVKRLRGIVVCDKHTQVPIAQMRDKLFDIGNGNRIDA